MVGSKKRNAAVVLFTGRFDNDELEPFNDFVTSSLGFPRIKQAVAVVMDPPPSISSQISSVLIQIYSKEFVLQTPT